jgi:5'-nucleotidase
LRILVSNDDGYFAPGLAALAQAMGSLGEVVVVAPERNRSGASNSLTLDRPLSLQKKENGFYAVNGTPTDCVHIALTGMAGARFDLVVSGINAGFNIGEDTLYSGTVAAATEAFLFGLPAIAFSLEDRGTQFLASAARVASELAAQLLANPFKEPVLLNVNLPALDYADINGREVTRLGRRHASEPVFKSQDPHGAPIYWIGPPGVARDAAAGTDFDALARGMVSVTPLKIDLSDGDLLEPVAHWLKSR